MRLTPLHTHTPPCLPLSETYPKVNSIPVSLKALTASSAAGCANPLPSPNPTLPPDTHLGPTEGEPVAGGATSITWPGPRSRALSLGSRAAAITHPQLHSRLSRTQLRRAQDPLFGALCSPPSWFLLSNLPPSSPHRSTQPTGKLLPSCGGASSPPSNAPSNRVTSAPSGPMRAENSCAPASRSEPGARGASETGGPDLQEPGLPAELQLPLLPPSRCCRRCCQHPLKSDSTAKTGGSTEPRAFMKQVDAPISW
ncbi:uncharacterized protein LOC105074651 [Camelus bactrianus]|uniref:Uncharacterized protein LOC105074651 n=1 Tax=Camelus bactrianus TaxID=9837 RepID=A0A9W3EZV8_CAMBA